MYGLESFFSTKDWVIVALYLAGTALATTWYHRRGGRASSPCAPLPWPVVAASLAASELTAWLVLAVPGAMLAIHGDLAFLSWILVSLLVRLVFGGLLIRRGWSLHDEAGMKSGDAPGPGLRKLMNGFGHLASLLGQGLRLVVLALPLLVLTDWRIEVCLLLVWLPAMMLRRTGAFRAVVRGEWMHLLALIAAFGAICFFLAEQAGLGRDAALGLLRQSVNFEGEARDKLAWLHFEADPARHFTVWTALFCLPWLQFQSLALDRANLLRLRLCASPRAAGLAVIAGGITVTAVLLILLAAGLALFLVYRQDPPTDPAILKALAWSAGEPRRVDLAIPVWILTEIPEGWRGLLFAVLFGAGFTGLHGALLASPAVIATGGAPGGRWRSGQAGILLWCLALLVLGLGMGHCFSESGEDLLSFGYALATYTAGPLLGLAWLGARGGDGMRPTGALIGAVVSLILVTLLRVEVVWPPLDGASLGEFMKQCPLFTSTGETTDGIRPILSHVWLWPFTALLTWACGWKKRQTRPLDS